MCFRRPFVTALSVLLVGVAAAGSLEAEANATHTMYLTFNTPVALPGVTLGRGTYIFELPEATGDHSLVRVSSRDRKTVYLTAFTTMVNRPAGMNRDQVISLGEAPGIAPPPIDVWWPEDSAGRRFTYAKK
jgi:hypothetical protein